MKTPNNNNNNKDADEIKIAVKIHPELVDEKPQSKEKLNWFIYRYQKGQRNCIAAIIQEAIQYWSLDERRQYSLILVVDEAENLFRFVTEDQLRENLTKGAVFEVYHSVQWVVQRMLAEMQQLQEPVASPGDRLPFLRKLAQHCRDGTFVAELDRHHAFQTLARWLPESRPDELCQLLEIVAQALEHSVGQLLDDALVHFLADLVLVGGDSDSKLLVRSLGVLRSAVLADPLLPSVLHDRGLSWKQLSRLLLEHHAPESRTFALALANALLQHQEPARRRELFDQWIKPALVRHVFSQTTDQHSAELLYQLYVLQMLLLRWYEKPLALGASPDQAAEKCRDIRHHYETEMEEMANKYQAVTAPGDLLLRSHNAGFGAALPPESFGEPPGLLVIELLGYYSQHHNESFVRWMVANQSSTADCPLTVAAFRILTLLVELLGLGQPTCGPADLGARFHAMLLRHDHPLEELFSIGLTMFNRTWHEIHAAASDLDIVSDFLAEKLQQTLSNEHATASFESFEKELAKISYADISGHWREERARREHHKEQMAGVKQLRCLLRPDMLGIVRQNRLNYLVRGTRFDKYTAKGQRLKDKYWYCRLSANHKTLLYGDVDDACHSLDEKLTNKLELADVARLLTGKECPHMRDAKGKKTTVALAFALVPRADDGAATALCFVAAKSEIFDYWVDGLNALLEQPMTSNQATKDVDMLLDLDVKLRLLDVDGIDIPDRAPELPPSPPDYDFQYGAPGQLDSI